MRSVLNADRCNPSCLRKIHSMINRSKCGHRPMRIISIQQRRTTARLIQRDLGRYVQSATLKGLRIMPQQTHPVAVNTMDRAMHHCARCRQRAGLICPSFF